VGCGSGIGGIEFRSKAGNLFGVDLSIHMVMLARSKRYNTRTGKVVNFESEIYRDDDMSRSFGNVKKSQIRYVYDYVHFGEMAEFISGAQNNIVPKSLDLILVSILFSLSL